jgi:hypothetical protein
MQSGLEDFHSPATGADESEAEAVVGAENSFRREHRTSQ